MGESPGNRWLEGDPGTHTHCGLALIVSAPLACDGTENLAIQKLLQINFCQLPCVCLGPLFFLST